MALLPAPKPLAGSLTRQPRKFPTNPSPAATAALANIGRTPPVNPIFDPAIGVSKPVNPAGISAVRAAAAAATAGDLRQKRAMMTPRGFGAAIKA